jgi:hypothetical protein
LFGFAWQRSFPRRRTSGTPEEEVDTQNTDGLLLEDIGRIAHIDVQKDVVGRTAGLQLKAETDQAM